MEGSGRPKSTSFRKETTNGTRYKPVSEILLNVIKLAYTFMNLANNNVVYKANQGQGLEKVQTSRTKQPSSGRKEHERWDNWNNMQGIHLPDGLHWDLF